MNSDIVFERVDKDKQGNVTRIYMFLGGKWGYFFRNREHEIEWFTIDLGEVESHLVRRARKIAQQEFPPPPRRSFPRALVPSKEKGVLWVFVRLILPGSQEDEGFGRWYGMNIRTEQQFMKPFRKDEHNPFSVAELKQMWTAANQVLKKERQEILKGRRQMDMFAE